ncbi:S-type pyocin domain-containing protein [Pseudomonas sp. LP_7_YM]|uniref:S-type pyocin domain-containing protein n=1 Tax=Pseudomonas sp. LP_7_YM TaxID=2485137 RepID=UPI00105C6E62|nr:S-type pyocin domain-containing protein [Pseudomonas sp. LP_7_YM]
MGRDVDLDFIASRKGTVEVTHRMAFEETDGQLTNVWTKAEGVTVGARVSVRSFVYNPNTNAYEFTRDDEAKPSLVWTPAVSPGNSSTSLPGEAPDVDHYTGKSPTPISEAAGDYPTYDIDKIEDYILVFPDESGLDPVYVMFKSPSYLPGIVSGIGGSIDPNWEAAASKGLGSPIPSPVADALRGRKYAEFRNLKKAIWREMSKLPEVIKDMNARNIELMQKGNSPVAPKRERNGGRIWYEIHHARPISEGGEVYAIDNLTFNSPANHDSIHKDIREKEKLQ